MGKNVSSQSGVAALLIVVIIGAVCVILAKSLSRLSISDLNMSYLDIQGSKTLDLTESCLEEILRRIQIDPDWRIEDYTLNLSDGVCELDVVGVTNEVTINIAGNFSQYHKKLKAEIKTGDDGIVLNNWEEISE